jgi:hypothetical protein
MRRELVPHPFSIFRTFGFSVRQVKLVGFHIGSKKYILQAIVIDITDSYAAAIIKIPIGIDIECCVI